jgi:pyrimidine-nucleoside phosphorylase
VGNASEAAEAFAALRGDGPEDLFTLTRELGAAMLVLSGVARERHEAAARLERALESGEAVRRAEAWVEAQGGDPGVISDPGKLPVAAVENRVHAPRAGFVTRVDARILGELLVAMGGGRMQREDLIDPAVGIRLLCKAGAKVEAGEVIAIVRAHEEAPQWAAIAESAYAIGDTPPPPRPLVLEEIAD